MSAPAPRVISWQSRQLRVRHDDPHLTPYSPRASVIRAAVVLASDTEGLRLALTSALGVVPAAEANIVGNSPDDCRLAE